MAYFNDTQASHQSFFERLANVLRNIATSIDLAASSNARMRQMEQLSALSDAELAEKGLRREDIARHVFRDVLYI